jgi:hypothetical protein
MFCDSDFQPMNAKYFNTRLRMGQEPSLLKMKWHYLDRNGPSEGNWNKSYVCVEELYIKVLCE